MRPTSPTGVTTMRDAIVEAIARGAQEAKRQSIIDRIKSGKVSASLSGVEYYPPWDDADQSLRRPYLDDAQAALAAIEAMGATVGVWQDIASAPREEWNWLLGTDGLKVAPMCWMEKCDDERFTGWCGATPRDGGMLYCNHVELGFEPTHWMALPAAPMQQGEG